MWRTIRGGRFRPTILVVSAPRSTRAAAEVAIKLATELDARVVGTDVGVPSSGHQSSIDQLHDREVDAVTTAVVRTEDGRQRILREASELCADMILVAPGPQPRSHARGRLLVNDLLLAGWPVLWAPHPLVGTWRWHRMLGRIVLAVADDEPTRRAASWAAYLGCRAAAEVVIVHVCTPPIVPVALVDCAGPWAGELSLLADVENDRSRGELAVWVARMRRATVTVRSELRRGPVPAEVAAVAEESSAGLVIVGARRHRSWIARVRPHTGERVARASSRPVLLVP
jgi:nucleotide-binding universal stress UspA family protein